MKQEERAQLAWQMLTGAARNRQILTYQIVGARIGVAPVGMGQVLHPVMTYCETHKLPPLTVLVVNKATGLPGEGLTTLDELNRDREAVFEFNWDSRPPPSARELKASVEQWEMQMPAARRGQESERPRYRAVAPYPRLGASHV